MTRKSVAIVLAAIVAGLTIGCGLIAYTVSKPCPTEDSLNCTWDADVRSNGQGDSFTTISLFDGRVFIQVQR